MRAWLSVLATLVAGTVVADVPGGVRGVVYVQGTSPEEAWVPLPDAAVLVEACPTESLPRTGGTLIVEADGLPPPLQVLTPGAGLTVISRSSLVHRLHAWTEVGERVFSLALTIPGLEVTKKVHARGLVTVRCTERGHAHEKAHVFVTPHVAWALTDATGRFFVRGVPPGRRSIRAVHPTFGTSSDSVWVSEARAAECTLYVVRVDLPPSAGLSTLPR